MPWTTIAKATLSARQEDEIRKVATAIHDDLGQNLALLRLRLAQILREQPDVSQEIIGLIDDTLEKLRKIVLGLRPSCLEEFGISTSLQLLVTEFQKKTGIRCELKMEPLEINLRTDKNLEIYRIVQESLTNVLKHSGAAFCSVYLTRTENSVKVEIFDNGCGITEDQTKDHTTLGIDSMKQRASNLKGAIEIFGRPDWGTKIKVEIPLESQMEANA